MASIISLSAARGQAARHFGAAFIRTTREKAEKWLYIVPPAMARNNISIFNACEASGKPTEYRLPGDMRRLAVAYQPRLKHHSRI